MYAVHKYECKYTRIYVYVWNVYIGVQSGACVCKCVCSNKCVHLYMYMYIFVYVYGVLMHMYIRECMHRIYRLKFPYIFAGAQAHLHAHLLTHS